MHREPVLKEHRIAGTGQAAAVSDEAVADFFCDVFDLASVSPDDNFFRLGGDSLLAETLMTGIKAAFGIELPISVLVESPTPRSLATVLREKCGTGRRSNLITARSGDIAPVLVCVHGTNGDSLTACYLAECLAPGRTVFGFKATGLEAGETPMFSVEDMADAYFKAYLEKAKIGEPVILLGHCAASVIAYEMAQRMKAAGCDVAGLILIDPASGKKTPFLQNPSLALANRSLQKVRRYIWHRRHASSGAVTTIDQRRCATKRAIQFAMRCYEPQVLDVPCLFIYTTGRKSMASEGSQYRTLLPRGEFVEFKADHVDLFARHSAGLAVLIDAFIGRVSGAGNRPKQSVPA